MITGVSLFAGVGGFDLAMQRKGVKVVASVEIDKKCNEVLAKHFPNVAQFTDVTTVKGEDLINAGFTPRTGIITGGFPCQDVSVAGKRAGLSNADGTATRSGLFWQVVRLLKETKAQYFVLENVPGLLSSNNGHDFGTVIGALDELGYGISWRILDAQYFGVAQRRRRVFIVGCLGNPECASQILAITEGRSGYLETSEQKGKAVARKVGSGVVGSLQARDYKGVNHEGARDGKLVIGVEAFGQSGYGDYSEGVKTLNASMYKRPEDSVVIDFFTPSSFAQYQEGVGTLRSNGGDLGGGQRDIVGALCARDYKGVGNQYVAENKLVY